MVRVASSKTLAKAHRAESRLNKEESYRLKRKKNNESAKRSRDKRRRNSAKTYDRLEELVKMNTQLQRELLGVHISLALAHKPSIVADGGEIWNQVNHVTSTSEVSNPEADIGSKDESLHSIPTDNASSSNPPSPSLAAGNSVEEASSPRASSVARKQHGLKHSAELWRSLPRECISTISSTLRRDRNNPQFLSILERENRELRLKREELLKERDELREQLKA